jgi:hypothetical protein
MRRLTFHLLSCLLAVRVAAASLVLAADCPTGDCPLAPPAAANDIAVDARPIARIENTTAAGRSYGSGTLVDVDGSSGLVVTCAHLFRDGTGTIIVMFPERSRHSARLVKIDHDADLAALAISVPAATPVEIATDYPQQGDPLVSCGYGSDGRLGCNRGQVLGYVTTLGSHGRETLELSGSARLGDSGGPVLDRQGHLVAVLFGTNGRVVDATFCGRVRQFLQGLSPRFGGKPADSAAPNGGTPTPRLENLPPRILRPNRPRPDSRPPENQPPAADPLGRAADALGSAAQPWLSAKLAALLISVGVPGGIAGVAGGAIVWIAMRRGKKKLRSQLDRLQNRTTTTSDTDYTTEKIEQSEPAQQRIIARHHNRYVAYEAGSIDKAWAAAHARVGEKYPGAVPYLKIVEGVKDQLLSGIEEPQLS